MDEQAPCTASLNGKINDQSTMDPIPSRWYRIKKNQSLGNNREQVYTIQASCKTGKNDREDHESPIWMTQLDPLTYPSFTSWIRASWVTCTAGMHKPMQTYTCEESSTLCSNHFTMQGSIQPSKAAQYARLMLIGFGAGANTWWRSRLLVLRLLANQRNGEGKIKVLIEAFDCRGMSEQHASSSQPA
eukprot:scaffold175376_cov14-Tisochrysis_lutea.AAC.1